jgi:hypothetical protein
VKSNRSSTDLLLLMIAGTVCVSVLVSLATVVVQTFVSPENKGGFAAVADIINTLISLLAGFLAGRTESTRRPNGKSDNQ